jgi:hypothetical protein
MRTVIAKMKYQNQLWTLVLIISLITLAACSNGGSTAPAQTKLSPTLTLPAVKPGTVLYQADWSKGLDGWSSTGGWQAVQGQLQGDSLEESFILAPYKPTTANYAVEARIQVVHLLRAHGGSLSLFAKQGRGTAGFQAGVAALMGPGPRTFGSNPQLQIYAEPGGPSNFYVSDYDPQTQWHTYRVEVQDDSATLVVDGIAITTINSEQPYSTGPLGISSGLVLLRVSSFRVLAM